MGNELPERARAHERACPSDADLRTDCRLHDRVVFVATGDAADRRTRPRASGPAAPARKERAARGRPTRAGGLARGGVFAAYLVLTGVARFLVEFIRINPRSFLGMSNAQAASVVSVIAGALLWQRLKKTSGAASITDHSSIVSFLGMRMPSKPFASTAIERDGTTSAGSSTTQNICKGIWSGPGPVSWPRVAIEERRCVLGLAQLAVTAGASCAPNRFDRLRARAAGLFHANGLSLRRTFGFLRTRCPIGMSIDRIDAPVIATRLAARENHEPVRLDPDRDFLAGESRNASHRADELARFLTVQLQFRQEFPFGAQPILEFSSRSPTAIEKYFVSPVGDVIIGLQQAIREVAQGQAFSSGGHCTCVPSGGA